jgi:transposase
MIGLDIAKHVFHAHGADERGRAIFSKRISRGKLLEFFADQPSCTVALEACGERITGPVSSPSLAIKFG